MKAEIKFKKNIKHRDMVIPKKCNSSILGDHVKDMKSGLSRKLSVYDIGLPVIRSNNLVNNKIDFTDIKYWYKDDPQGANTENYFLNKGDVLVNFINSISQIGKTALFDIAMSRDFIYTTNILKLSLKNTLDSKYFIYLSQSYEYFKYVLSITKPAVNQASFTTKDFKKMKLQLPPLFEQQKTAQILSTWDKAIELKEKLIEEKKMQKKGLMQKLLTGEMRLPGFDGEWKEVRLGDLGKIVTGTTPPTKISEYYGGEYPWITPTDIKEKKNIENSERRLTEHGLKKGRFVPKGSLLITCIASIGKNAILTIDGSCNQQINAILPSEKHSNDFLYYLLSKNKKLLISYAGTSATPILNKKTFSNIFFKIPNIQEQCSIAMVLSTIDYEIDVNTEILQALKLQKKGLMQLLLTGIVRVNVK